MCGIVGATGPGARRHVEELISFVGHRGPDGSGIWNDEDVALGHTRLAVLDPTDASAQPFVRGPLTITYNGEIYNHVELRRELEASGSRFATSGDTEVFAELLRRRGTAAFNDIEGMFAAAIWDGRDSSLTLVRDRHGIKPLYWQTRSGGIEFCSELSPLRGGSKNHIRTGALREFLRFGAPVSAPIIDGVAEIEPGTTMRIDASGIHVRSFAAGEYTHMADGTTAVDALHLSIAQHARSDRPTVLFLSGGFDSAAVLRGLRDSGARPLGLTLATDDNHEDVGRARETAAHYGIEHEVFEVDEATLLGNIEGFVSAMDQPGIDGFNTYLISQMAARIGYPVALSGLGGDEVLGGYRYYRTEHHLRRAETLLGRLPKPLLSVAARRAASLTGKSETRIAQVLVAQGTAERHMAFRSLFSEVEVETLTRGPSPRSIRWDVDRTIDQRQQLATLDRRTYLRPTLLRDADIYSMWHGVELRVPFVDSRVLEAVLARGSAPTKHELATAWNDPFLVAKAAEPKLTFRLPWDRWLGALRTSSSDVLSSVDPWHGLIDPSAARAIVDNDTRGSGEPLRPWALLVLAHWLGRRAECRSSPAVSMLKQEVGR
ncbi:MAG: asparagine synthase (glutamine-hydrolyzing) [Actinomycetia bacterium]|nr:asparagine synthase (glutamine-hydrolyzing) [Actinomycetes bacterium]